MEELPLEEKLNQSFAAQEKREEKAAEVKNIDNKVILIDGKGMKYKISGTNGEDNSEDFTFDGLNRDKFSI